jgi:hypothetical protein
MLAARTEMHIITALCPGATTCREQASFSVEKARHDAVKQLAVPLLMGGLLAISGSPCSWS